MNASVTIIDYGVGNLHNVCRAFEYCDASVEITADPHKICNADRLVLPGVGAFADGMSGLDAINGAAAIKQYVELQRPFLGICLGMQIMLESSTEFGRTAGLSLLPGEVVAIPAQGSDGKPHKIPRIGWEPLLLPKERKDWKGSILEGVAPGSSVYFVHSYMAAPHDPNHRLANYDYDGVSVCAAIEKDNLFGCQFHPEKSGDVGLDIIRNFLAC